LSFINNGTLVDLGAGTNAINPLLQLMGMKVSILDDFGDPGYENFNANELFDSIHRKIGINVFRLDFLKESLPFDNGSVDVITTYDGLEHWGKNIKHVMDEVARVIRPGGLFVIGVPNAANI